MKQSLLGTHRSWLTSLEDSQTSPRASYAFGALITTFSSCLLTPLGDANSPLSFVPSKEKGGLHVTLTYITRSELATRLEHKNTLTLLAVLSNSQYRTGRIPSSIRFTTLEDILELVPAKSPIVVYCKGPSALDAEWAYRLLLEHDYSNLRIYPGGLSDWTTAGLPLEHDAHS